MAQLLMTTLFERFLAHQETYGRPRTQAFYANCCRALGESLGDVPAGKLTAEHVNRMLKRNEQKKVGTRNAYLRTLKAVLNYGLNNEYLSKVPVRFKLLKQVRPKNVVIFNKEQVKALMSHADMRERILIMLLGATAMRIDEALHLKWHDVDAEKCRILVTAKPEVDWSPKTHTEREVYIPAAVMNKLSDFREKLTHGKDKDWIFQSGSLSTVLARGERLTTTYEKMRAIFKAAGLYVPGKLHHQLRKAAASFWMMNGIDMKTIQELLGHSDIKTTASFYVFSNTEAKQEAARRSIV